MQQKLCLIGYKAINSEKFSVLLNLELHIYTL